MQLTWGTGVYMFCSADCCLRYLADNSTPMVVVPND